MADIGVDMSESTCELVMMAKFFRVERSCGFEKFLDPKEKKKKKKIHSRTLTYLIVM